MRIAVVSDIHGNRTALEAVLADLRHAAPDLVFHGGDLTDAGASPVEVLDRIRSLGWPGVMGNTDEMLARPASLREYAAQSPAMRPLLPVIEEMAAFTQDRLGEERLAWLRALPLVQTHGPLALVHASPDTPWRAPGADASDAELEPVYSRLAHPIIAYGHIHRPFLRPLPGMTVANSGSVGLSYDGDPRASYLLLEETADGWTPTIRRVAYDTEREQAALAASGLPHADWTVRILAAARPQLP